MLYHLLSIVPTLCFHPHSLCHHEYHLGPRLCSLSLCNNLCVHRIWRKRQLINKTLRNRKFSTGKFIRASTHAILTNSGFKKYNWFGWPSLCFEVIAAQNDVIRKNRLCYKKIKRCQFLKTLCQFWSDCWEIESEWSWVHFNSISSDRTKIGVVSLNDTAIQSRQISKRGSTSAARNLALKTPLPYIFWTVWTWGFTRWHPTIPIQKFE